MGINERVYKRARARFDARIEDRMRALANQKGIAQCKAAQSGMGRSSGLDRKILDLRKDEIAILCKLAWADVLETFNRLGRPKSPDLENDLAEAVRSLINLAAPNFTNFFKPSISPTVYPDQSVEKDIEKAMIGIEAEIGLFADEMKFNSQSEAGSRPGPTTINFNAPVNSVVTGRDAQVIVQQINDHKEDILQAIKAVKEAATEIDDHNSRNIIDLVDRIHDEISKPDPNPITAKSLIGGLFSTIQTIAALGPATHQLAQALRAWFG